MQDDATGKILAAQFFPSETASGYLCLLRQLLRRHGVSLAFYGDHSGIFVRNDDSWTVEEQLAGKRHSTQFGRALEQLGITFIAAHSLQAKGRVERLWGVLQDRLTSELRLAKAADIDSANAVLRKFIADYNRRFSRRPRKYQTAWRAAPENLERICCFVHERVVSNDNIVQWKGRRFQIPSRLVASASPVPKCISTKLSMGGSRSTTATPAWEHFTVSGGDSFMLLLGRQNHVATTMCHLLLDKMRSQTYKKGELHFQYRKSRSLKYRNNLWRVLRGLGSSGVEFGRLIISMRFAI